MSNTTMVTVAPRPNWKYGFPSWSMNVRSRCAQIEPKSVLSGFTRRSALSYQVSCLGLCCGTELLLLTGHLVSNRRNRTHRRPVMTWLQTDYDADGKPSLQFREF